MSNDNEASTSASRMGSASAPIDLSSSDDGMEDAPSASTTPDGRSNGYAPSPSRKRKRTDADDDDVAMQAASAPATNGVASLEDMQASRVAALQEREREQENESEADATTKRQRNRQKRPPKPEGDNAEAAGELKLKNPRNKKGERALIRELKTASAKKLRDRQWKFIIASLEERDRGTPNFATRTSDRETEAHQLVSLLTNEDVKKPGKIKLKTELLEQLAQAGIGSWDEEKAQEEAMAIARDRLRPENQVPTKASIKTERRNYNAKQRAVVIEALEKLTPSKRNADAETLAKIVDEREAEAMRRVLLVNNPNVKKQAALREKTLKILLAAGMNAWFIDASEPEGGEVSKAARKGFLNGEPAKKAARSGKGNSKVQNGEGIKGDHHDHEGQSESSGDEGSESDSDSVEDEDEEDDELDQGIGTSRLAEPILTRDERHARRVEGKEEHLKKIKILCPDPIVPPRKPKNQVPTPAQAVKEPRAKPVEIDDDREEGELGLGDLFMVDTTPADLPEELKKAREAQGVAQAEAEANGVDLDAQAEAPEDKRVPDYVGAPKEKDPEKIGTVPTSRALDKGKGRAVNQDPMSESESSEGDHVEPADLAVNMQATAPGVPVDPAVIDDDEDEEEQAFRAENRYFKEDDPDKQCRRCGEIGHLIKDCEHIVCLTCGKLDEHGTRECPLSMTCFRCGSRGHHVQTCPVDPAQARAGRHCERCSSSLHMSLNCPYIWRVYIRDPNAPKNPPKHNPYCYNCASDKHFGDDCNLTRGHPLKYVDRSAFTLNENRTNTRGAMPDTFAPDEELPGNGRVHLPRPNIVNGKRMSGPPANAPNGPRAMQNQPDKTRADMRGEKRNFQQEVEEAKRSTEQTYRGDIGAAKSRRHGQSNGAIDFGDLNGMDSEEDEEEDFAKRLKGPDGKARNAGVRPGARDRRNARESEKPGPNRGAQLFKNFKEGRNTNNDTASERGSIRSRSRSRSPPRRHRGFRQPSPPSHDSDRGHQSDRRNDRDSSRRRDYSPPRHPHPLADRLSNGRDGDRQNRQGSSSSYRDRPRPRSPQQPVRPTSLLDRIQKTREDLNFPRGSDRRNDRPQGRDTFANGDGFVSLGGDDHNDRRGGDRYMPLQTSISRRPMDRLPARPANSGGRYRGGYV